MGIFSGVKKAVKKVFRGVGKAFKAVGGAVKDFLGSKLGKVFMIAVAVWLGGAAIGLWNSGFAAIDGALVASQTAGAVAPAAAEVAGAGAGAAATESAVGAATGGAMGAAPAVGSPFTAAAPGVVSGVGGGGATMAAAATPFTAGAPAAVPSIVGGATVPGAGLMSTAGKAVSGAAKWMAANPIPTLVGGQMLANAMTPNANDIAEEEAKRRQQEIDAANSRFAQVGGINTWGYSGATLPPPVPPITTQAGIMGRRLI